MNWALILYVVLVSVAANGMFFLGRSSGYNRGYESGFQAGRLGSSRLSGAPKTETPHLREQAGARPN